MASFSPHGAGEVKTLQSLNAQQQAMIGLIEANFTSTVLYMTQERDIAIRDRDKHHQQAITLRRDNSMLQEQLTSYTRYPLAVRPSVRPSVLSETFNFVF